MANLLYMVCVACVVVAGTQGSPEDCVYRLQQCFSRMNSIEQKVNSVEAKQALNEGRQESFVSEMFREVNITKQDTKAVKTVVNTLVEDNVKMHGEIRMVNDVGYDVMNLRREMNGMSQKMSTEVDNVKREVNKITRSLEQESQASMKVSALMSSQMNKNNQLLEELQGKLGELEDKITRMEKSMTGGNGGAEMEHLQGMMSELTSRMDGFQDYYGKKIEMLVQELNDVSH